MTDRNEKFGFNGDVTPITGVKVKQNEEGLALTLKRTLAESLGWDEAKLFAATVELGGGNTLLIVASDDGNSRFRITRIGEDHIEVTRAGQDEADTADLVVDEVTEAFLALKKHLYIRGELDLSDPITAEEIEALSRKDFERLEHLYKK